MRAQSRCDIFFVSSSIPTYPPQRFPIEQKVSKDQACRGTPKALSHFLPGLSTCRGQTSSRRPPIQGEMSAIPKTIPCFDSCSFLPRREIKEELIVVHWYHLHASTQPRSTDKPFLNNFSIWSAVEAIIKTSNQTFRQKLILVDVTSVVG